MNTYAEDEDLDEYEDADHRQADEIAAIDLEADDGPRWDTAGLIRDFEVTGFAAPFVVVIRKSDRQRGTLEYVSWPRTYFGFHPYVGP